MIEAAYYYGLAPGYVASMTAGELAQFVRQQHSRRQDDRKFLAELAYASGMLGSMSLSASRPKFEELFPSLVDEPTVADVERSRLAMIAYAENLNRKARKEGDKSG